MGRIRSRKLRLGVVALVGGGVAFVPSAAAAEEVCQYVGDPLDPTAWVCVTTSDAQPLPHIEVNAGVTGVAGVSASGVGTGHIFDTNEVCVYQYLITELSDVPQSVCVP